jgi:YD repeat-containing protein
LSGDLDLTEVTQADNTFVTFTYDAFNNITSVNDTNGKVLESHTYDSTGRGLSSSRANGVDALTISYPQ